MELEETEGKMPAGALRGGAGRVWLWRCIWQRKG